MLVSTQHHHRHRKNVIISTILDPSSLRYFKKFIFLV